MYRIAAMGDKDSVSGFAALGLTVFPVENPADAVAALRKMVNGNFAVIYITEALAAEISEEIDKYRDMSRPAVILIPGVKGNTGMGLRDVSRSVEKAVGSDIIS